MAKQSATNSIIDTLLDTINTTFEGSKDTIDSDVGDALDKLQSSINLLGSTSYTYIKKYNDYLYDTTVDAELVKAKLKDNVARVFNNEL